MDKTLLEDTITIMMNVINDLRITNHDVIDNKLFINLTEDKLRKWLTKTAASEIRLDR